MIYLASRKYSLKDLEVSLRVRVIQRFSDELSLPDILKETKDVFLRLLEDKNSFLNHIKYLSRLWLLRSYYLQIQPQVGSSEGEETRNEESTSESENSNEGR